MVHGGRSRIAQPAHGSENNLPRENPVARGSRNPRPRHAGQPRETAARTHSRSAFTPSHGPRTLVRLPPQVALHRRGSKAARHRRGSKAAHHRRGRKGSAAPPGQHANASRKQSPRTAGTPPLASLFRPPILMRSQRERATFDLCPPPPDLPRCTSAMPVSPSASFSDFANAQTAFRSPLPAPRSPLRLRLPSSLASHSSRLIARVS